MKEQIVTKYAPPAVGPYSQAIKLGNLVFTSGQFALDQETGKVEGDIAQQTETALKNVSAILEAAGSSMNNVIKATVFITDMNDFNVVNEVYKKFFEEKPPARSCVQVAALPKGANVEVEVIAFID